MYRWIRRNFMKFTVLTQQQKEGSWERSLLAAHEYVEICRSRYMETIRKVGAELNTENSDYQVFQSVVADITESSIRIGDSVMWQLTSGHPDTSMSSCRQLFELSLNLQLITIDSSFERARRYKDFADADLLRVEKGIAELIAIDGDLELADQLELQLKEYEGLYLGESLNVRNWAIISLKDREDNLGEPIGKIKAIAEAKARGHQKAAKYFEQQLRQNWLILTKWAHADYISHHNTRRLGARGKETRVLGPSYTGFDSPLLLAISSLSETIEAFLKASGVYGQPELVDISKEFNERRSTIRDIIREVDPDIRSNDYIMAYVVFEEDMQESPEDHT